jgi:hypothetical protein
MSQGLRPGGAAVDQPGVATPGTNHPSVPAPKGRQSQPKLGIHLTMLSAFPGDLSYSTLTGSAGPAGAWEIWVGVRSLGLPPQAGQRPPLQGGSRLE